MKNFINSLGSIYLVVLGIICVQTGAAFAKYLFPALGANGTVTVRLAFASIILLTVFRVKIFGRKKSDYLWCLLYGISLAGMNLSFYLAISRVPLGLGVTFEFLGPLLLAISLSRKYTDFIWAALAGLGIAMIAPWSNSGSLDIVGILLALLAGLFWVGYILCGKKISGKMKPIDAVALGMFAAFLLVLPFGINDGVVEKINLKLMVIGIAVALLSSAIPFSLDMKAFKNISSKTYSILMSLHPAVAALSGFLFLGEKLSVTQSCSVLFVVVASVGSAITSKR
jgi:inner membrane transporter RhtA